MKKCSTLATAGALIACLFSTQAFAQATFAPVTAPEGSVNTGVFGINDQGRVAGSYSTDANNLIGFVGSIDGTYETFEFDANPTQPRSLNNQGRIVGMYFNLGQGALNQFERTKQGELSTITKDGAPLFGIAQGVNPSGVFVGDYRGEPGAVPQRGGYQGKNAAWQSDVTLPFAALRVAPRAINAQGDIAGWFVPESGDSIQGFVIKDGETTVLNYPGAVATFIQGLNDKGEMSGQWDDADGIPHGFVLDSDLETWTSFDAPGFEYTQAFQINNLGQVAVNGFGETSSGAFIYCPKKAGVCAGNRGKAAAVKKAKGKSGKAPAASMGNGPVDPDTTPRKNGHRK